MVCRTRLGRAIGYDPSQGHSFGLNKQSHAIPTRLQYTGAPPGLLKELSMRTTPTYLPYPHQLFLSDVCVVTRHPTQKLAEW